MMATGYMERSGRSEAQVQHSCAGLSHDAPLMADRFDLRST